MSTTTLQAAPSLLDALTGPGSERDFFDTYWEKHSVLFRREGAPLDLDFDVQSYFDSMSSETLVKSVYKDPQGQHRECRIEPDQARRLYDAGLTICASQIHRGHAQLGRSVDDLQAHYLGTQFNYNGYLSPKGSGFGIHFDSHSVWIIQVEGSKRWFYGDEPQIPYPLTNCIYPLRRARFKLPWYTVPRPDDVQMNEIVLEPGDILYLPAGVWHRTEATGYSLSLTLSAQPHPAGKFITEVLQNRSFLQKRGRRPLPSVTAHGPDRDVSERLLRETLAESLEALRHDIDQLTVEDLAALWVRQIDPEVDAR